MWINCHNVFDASLPSAATSRGREKSVRVPEVIPLLLRKRACRARRRHQSEGVAPKDRTEHEPATFAYAALQAVFIKIGAAAARAARDLLGYGAWIRDRCLALAEKIACTLPRLLEHLLHAHAVARPLLDLIKKSRSTAYYKSSDCSSDQWSDQAIRADAFREESGPSAIQDAGGLGL